MKSTITENKKPAFVKTYPYIGKSASTGLIVLFTGENTGMVVGNTGQYELGHYDRNGWPEYNFFPFDGKVVLEN